MDIDAQRLTRRYGALAALDGSQLAALGTQQAAVLSGAAVTLANFSDATVIRRSGAKTAYAVDVTERIYNFRNPGPSVRLEGSRTSGSLRLEGAMYAQGYSGFIESGPGNFIRSTGAGASINRGQSAGNGESRIYQANGAAEYKAGADTFRLTAGVVQNEPLFFQYGDLVTPTGLRTFERSLSHNKNRTAELGGDYQHRFSPLATGRLVGLHTYKHNTTVSQTLAPGRLQESNKDNTGGESILRGTLSVQQLWGINFETETTVVDTYISYLRKKLHKDGFEGIRTVRGVGFQLQPEKK